MTGHSRCSHLLMCMCSSDQVMVVGQRQGVRVGKGGSVVDMMTLVLDHEHFSSYTTAVIEILC